jgi:hypothetical protein
MGRHRHGGLIGESEGARRRGVRQLRDPAALTPIESELWTPDGDVPAPVELLVRGSPITPEKLWAHAVRQAREYSFRDKNMFSVGADVVMETWPLDRIRGEQLATYSRYATAGVPTVRAAGFTLVATGVPPPVDVVLPAQDRRWAEKLAEFLRPNELRSPYKSRK